MSWVKLDDAFYRSAKVMRLSDGAYRTFVDALCYCADNLTDGVLEDQVIDRMRWRKRAKELVGCGFWEMHERGFVVHDYLEYQMSREQVLRARETTRKRVGRLRGGRTQDVTPLQDESNAVSNATPIPTPDLTAVSVTPLPPEQSTLLERLHEQVRIRVFGGTNAPDTGWCEDLVRRGMTETDITAACDASAGKSLNYCRAVLERRVKAREDGNDPDEQRGAGASGPRGDGAAGAAQRGGLRAVGAGRGQSPRPVPGFDSTGLRRAIGESDDDEPEAADGGSSTAPVPLRSV